MSMREIKVSSPRENNWKESMFHVWNKTYVAIWKGSRSQECSLKLETLSMGIVNESSVMKMVRG